MPAWLRWVGLVVVGLALALGGAYWWFFLESSHPSGKFDLDIAKLRGLANSVQADKPAAVRVEHVGGYTPLIYEKHHVLAPGVVLIKSPGHTPGSQMVFVQLKNGAEYLFLGDVAWKMANVDLVRERPRAVTQFFLQEDRTAVALQLAAIKALKDANPSVHVVPGHDRSVLDAALTEGWLVKGFQ